VIHKVIISVVCVFCKTHEKLNSSQVLQTPETWKHTSKLSVNQHIPEDQPHRMVKSKIEDICYALKTLCQ
jgi:hypothetical protein